MKVHELAKELGIQSKEIIGLLQDKGYEIKAAASGLEEEHINIVMSAFAKNGSEAKATGEAKEAEAPKTEEAPKAENKTEAPKAETATGNQAALKSAKADTTAAEAPKKKKKIIFVSNPSNSKMPGARPPMSHNNMQGQARKVAPTPNPSKPIQLGPNQMINKATGKVMEMLPPKKPEPEVVEEVKTEPVATESRQSASNVADTRGERNNGQRDNRQERRDNSFDGRSNSGNYRNNNQGGGANRSDNRGQDRNNRNQGGASKPQDRFQGGKPGQAGGRGYAAPDFPSGKGGNNDNRRADKSKDKRSKKDALYEDVEIKNKNKAGRFIKPEKKEEPVEEIKVITIPEVLTIKDLADKMKMQPSVIIKKLFLQGKIVTLNQEISYEEAENIAIEFDIMCEQEVKVDVIEELLKEDEEAAENMVERAPVICVMGHVDHGKTSLLDYIRKSNVIAGEAGGITQHIGAYNVTLGDGRRITFLDTPGHEAFTAMRARGAQVTDIAIIIVAADDAVMPTTKEAIAHAQAANVPMVFAINKIDKPGANPDRVREELAAMNLLVEEWGGKYQCQEISAKKGIGISELLEKVLLEAEMLDLKANPNRKATGSIIESSLDKGRGYVSTVLVSNGTLRVGDNVIAGTSWGRIKAMFNERNARIEKAGPAEPAIILGLNGAPTAGDSFHVLETEQEARDIANKRTQLQREQSLRTQKRLTLSDISHRIALGSFKELNIIVKGDTDGSVEALSDSFIKLSTEKIKVNVIFKAVGQISESDVTLADASDAIIVGFQVRPSAAARKQADQAGVEINTYSVIYDAIDDVTSAMEGMLDKVKKEVVTGQVEVREVYKISKVGTVAGCMVTEGKIHRSDRARVVRDGIVVHTADIAALKRYKDDVKEVATNFECGVSLVNFNDIQVGDVLETFTEIEVKQTL